MIRQATQEDQSAIFELAKKLATSAVVTQSGFDTSFASILALPHMVLLVAENEGELIGYALGSYYPCFYASGNVSWTAEVFVEEEWRRQGIGRLLMDGVEEWSTLNNCKLNTLATRRASHFYGALCYEETAGYFKKKIEG